MVRYNLPCLFCGKIVKGQVPIPSNENTFIIECPNCGKIILEFSEDEKK